MEDEKSFFDGYYTFEAVSISISNAFRGKGQKALEYRKKPILQEIEDANRPLSDEEIQRKRELFVATLQTMKTNFELSKQTAG